MNSTLALSGFPIRQCTIKPGLGKIPQIRLVCMNSWILFPVNLVSQLVGSDTTENNPYELTDGYQLRYSYGSALDVMCEQLEIAHKEFVASNTLRIMAPATPLYDLNKGAAEKTRLTMCHVSVSHCIRRLCGLAHLTTKASHNITNSISTEPHTVIQRQKELVADVCAAREEPLDVFDEDFDVFAADDDDDDGDGGHQKLISTEPNAKIPVFIGHPCELLEYISAPLEALSVAECASQLLLYPDKMSTVRVFVTLSRKNHALILSAVLHVLLGKLFQHDYTTKGATEVEMLCGVLAGQIQTEQTAFDKHLAQFRSEEVPVIHFHIESIPEFDFSLCTLPDFKPSMLVNNAIMKYLGTMKHLISAKIASVLRGATKNAYSKTTDMNTEIRVDVACDEKNYTLIRFIDTYSTPTSARETNKDYHNEQQTHLFYDREFKKYSLAFPSLVGAAALSKTPTTTLWTVPSEFRPAVQ